MTPWSILERRVLTVALLAAAVLRALHWESMRGFPWFDYLGLDAKYYDDWAQSILREGLQGKDPYFMGPLYPHFLAVVYKIAGRSLDAVRFLQLVMSVATVAAVHLLARRFAGPAVAMIASVACAIYGPIIYSSTSILFDAAIPVLLAPLLLLALLEAAGRRSVPFALGAGALLGVWALGRANILLFAPFAFLWLASAWGRPFAPRLAAWRNGLRGALALAAGAVICILPATIHNARTGDPTLLTTNGGLNLYIGNGPMASGGHETPVLEVERPGGGLERIVADLHKDVECRAEAERATGRTMKYTEVSDFYFRETLRTIRRAPGAFISGMVRKVDLFWSDYEIPQIEHFGYFRRFSRVLAGPSLTFGFIAPLGLVGMALALRNARRWALPLLFVGAFSTSVILFFVLDRYRMPIVPPLLLFAGFAIMQCVEAWRAGRRRNAAGIAGAAVLLGLFLHANVYGIDEKKGIAQIVYRLGIVEDSRENWEAAIAHYREAIALKPEYDRAHANLAADLARLGRAEEAMEHFRIAEELNPTYSRVPYNRGTLLDELGRSAEAEASYRRAVELEPRYLLARVVLAEALASRGVVDSARIELEAIRNYDGAWESEQNPVARARAARLAATLDDVDLLERDGRGDCFRSNEEYRRAEIARVRGRREETLGRLRALFERGPACAEAYRTLGLVLAEMNELPGAQDAFESAASLQPRLPGVQRELGRLAAIRGDADEAVRRFEAETKSNPKDPLSYLEIGLVHERLHGDSVAARPWFERFVDVGGSPEYLESRRRAWSGAPESGAR